MYQNLQVGQSDFEVLKKKISRKDPFKAQNSFHETSSVSGIHDEFDLSKQLETPSRKELTQAALMFNEGQKDNSQKPLKATDKHIYGAVPFEYRPGQAKKTPETMNDPSFSYLKSPTPELVNSKQRVSKKSDSFSQQNQNHKKSKPIDTSYSKENKSQGSI